MREAKHVQSNEDLSLTNRYYKRVSLNFTYYVLRHENCAFRVPQNKVNLQIIRGTALLGDTQQQCSHRSYQMLELTEKIKLS